uniref:Organ specific protein n=1 Tax=Heterorhabditis bacteriophora TaxID=37862 RepID=A0A1I7WWD2_HETBA
MSVHRILTTMLPILFFILMSVTCETVFERFGTFKKVRTSNPDYESDAIVGPKSVNEIGSFRGLPILTRQKNAYIDDNGVPVPLLPFNEDSAAANIKNRPKTTY